MPVVKHLQTDAYYKVVRSARQRDNAIKNMTHKTSGASLSGVYPPIISLAHTSLKNQPIWPTAHPIKSPAAAFHVPLMTHDSPTSANGRYGADIVKMPKSAIGVDGCRLDHI